MRLEHVGIAVANLEESNELFAKLFSKDPYKKEDVESILKLYKSQLGAPFCAWDDGYPCEENIAGKRG